MSSIKSRNLCLFFFWRGLPLAFPIPNFQHATFSMVYQHLVQNCFARLCRFFRRCNIVKCCFFFLGGLNFVEDCNNICCAIFLAITCEKTVPVTHKHNLYALTVWKLFAGNPSLCNDSFVWNHFQPLWSKLVFGYCDRGSNQNVSKTTPTFFPNKWSTTKWPWMDMVYLQICLLPKACIQHYLHAGDITKYVPPNGRHLDVTLQHLTNWTSNVERKSNMETNIYI